MLVPWRVLHLLVVFYGCVQSVGWFLPCTRPGKRPAKGHAKTRPESMQGGAGISQPVSFFSDAFHI